MISLQEPLSPIAALRQAGPQPRTWAIGFHGTSVSFNAFDNNRMGQGNDCNTALGFFFGRWIRGALGYVRHARNPEGEGYVIITAVPLQHCHQASLDDFWCHNERFEEDDVDHMGNWAVLPGEHARKDFQDQGFLSLSIDDIASQGTPGPVMAVFDAADTHILARIPAHVAEQLDAWLATQPLPAELEYQHWPHIQRWLAMHHGH